MNEGLFARLHDWLAREPVVLASVLEARGATPRKHGSRMLVSVSATHGTVGGGLAEARVIEAARQLLADQRDALELEIDLSGRPGALGICGGRMVVGLRRHVGREDRARVGRWCAALAAGEAAELTAQDLGGGSDAQRAHPDVRLLIVGLGHCGQALHDLARHLDFELRLFDDRDEELSSLAAALDTPRTVFAVCLNRDFQADVAALRVLCRRPPAFLGMIGSRKRIAEVKAALPEFAEILESMQAPIGLEIGAETPHEIAVSILAQLVERRRALA